MHLLCFPSVLGGRLLYTKLTVLLCSGFCAPYPERGLWFTYYEHILPDDFGKQNRHHSWHCRTQKDHCEGASRKTQKYKFTHVPKEDTVAEKKSVFRVKVNPLIMKNKQKAKIRSLP